LDFSETADEPLILPVGGPIHKTLGLAPFLMFAGQSKSEVKDPTCKTATWGTQIRFNDQYLIHPPGVI